MSAQSTANELTYVFMYSRDLNHGRLRLIIVVIFARSLGGISVCLCLSQSLLLLLNYLLTQFNQYDYTSDANSGEMDLSLNA